MASVTRAFTIPAQAKVQPDVCPIAVMYPERSLGSGGCAIDIGYTLISIHVFPSICDKTNQHSEE